MALVLLVPMTLVLPAAAAYVALLRNSIGMGGIVGLVVVVFLYILLGSMTLNGWLILRHPSILSERALPPRASGVLFAIWSTLAVWTVLMAIGLADWSSIVCAVVLAALSIASFIFSVRSVAPQERVPRTEFELGTTARVLCWLYLVLSAIAVLAAIGLAVTASSFSALGLVGGPATWAQLLLGLPWSHPLYLVTMFIAFVLSSVNPGVAVALAQSMPFLPVLANAVIVGLLLFAPKARLAIVNWFFRLVPKRP